MLLRNRPRGPLPGETQMRTLVRKTTALIAALALGAVMLTPATASAQGPTRPVTLPVVGTIATGGAFNGTATITRFVSQNGQLAAVGVLTGIVTNAAGTP